DLGMFDEQVLDLDRVHVLAARDDHLVVPAVDEQQPVLVEVPDVAAGQQPVDDLLVAAVGVALEGQSAAHEHATGDVRLGDAPALVVVERDPAADGRPAHRPGSPGPVLRRGDGGDGDLGRAVQVVDHG